MLLPAQTIDLSDDDLEALGRECSYVIDDLEREYSQYFKDLAIWWRWYEAVPKTQTKNFPFKDASNVVVPLIRIHSDALVNRFYASIFGQGRNRIWLGTTENEQITDRVNGVIRWINWAANGNDFNFRLAIYDWLSELVPIGSSVLACNWREDIRFAFAGTGGRGSARSIVARPVRFARGPLFEHVPREQILWDTGYLATEAPFIAREFRYGWSQLEAFAKRNQWDMSRLDGLDRSGRGLGGPSVQVTRDKDQRDSHTSDRRIANDLDIREVTVSAEMLSQMGFDYRRITAGAAEGEETWRTIPLVVTIHRNSRRVLWVRTLPYFFGYNNYFDGFFKKRSGRGHSVGLSKRMESMQQAMTVLLNQAIDSRTRANAIWAKTNSRELMQKPIDPSHPIFTGDMEGFEALNVGTSNLQDINLFNIVNVIAERESGQADPALGRESRQGGHPSPATSTLALLQQSDTMSASTRELLRLQVSRMGEAVASLYQQFETNADGRLQRVLGMGDAQKVEEFLFPTDPVGSVMSFDVVAMNESLNPQGEMQRALAVTQANTGYWAFVAQIMNVVKQAAAQGDQLSIAMAQKAIEAQTKAHMRFLEAGDVDDIESFVLQINRAAQQGTADLQRATGGLSELGAARSPAGVGGFSPGLPQLSSGGASGANGAAGLQ